MLRCLTSHLLRIRLTPSSWFLTIAEELYLGGVAAGNVLGGMLPSELGRLQQLEVLDLGPNFFSGQIIPTEIGGLVNLSKCFPLPMHIIFH